MKLILVLSIVGALLFIVAVFRAGRASKPDCPRPRDPDIMPLAGVVDNGSPNPVVDAGRGPEREPRSAGVRDAREDRPAPALLKSRMRVELERHFTPYEAGRLEALYLASANLERSEIRAFARDILGDNGFNLLMEKASPPPGVKDNTDEMVQFVLSNPPLVWWSRLKE